MSDFRPTPDWPRERGGWTQAQAVCEARCGMYLRYGFFNPEGALDQADGGAHDVRTENWHGKAVTSHAV